MTAVHIIRHTALKDSAAWVNRLTSFMDIYHLIKLFLVVLLLFILIVRTKNTAYGSWVFIFTLLLIDDSLLIHQSLGGKIAVWFNQNTRLDFNISPRYFELLILAIAAVFFALIILWVYFRSDLTFRKISQRILLFILALLIFGIIIDLATWIGLGTGSIYILGFVEDSGENITFSLIIWYLYLAIISQEDSGSLFQQRVHKRSI